MSNKTYNYSDVYELKDFAINDIAKKYFEIEDVNLLNIGTIGYVTDLVTTVTEDTFNSISTFLREKFVHLAQFPETLYNHATRLQIENLTATPSVLNMTLLINEKDIFSYGNKKDSIVEFVLDSDLLINIEGINFMPDFDILITAREYRKSYVFSAQYLMDYKNSISLIKTPYIKTTRLKVNNDNYVALFIRVRQVSKFKKNEQLISNDKVTIPTVSFDFEGQLANFEVFYKPIGSNNYVQMNKVQMGLPPLKTPFCFYSFTDENKVSISFTNRDGYFTPEFGSELKILYYTTLGSDGNFKEYTGTNISVTPSSEVYEYNNNLIVFAIPQGESSGGKNKITIDELRQRILEKMRTSGSFNVENDLQSFFSSYKNDEKKKVYFIKKRDDLIERLFTAFSLLKDDKGDFFKTNTLNINLFEEDFDYQYEQTRRFILNPGSVFKYDENSIDTLLKESGVNVSNVNINNYNNQFLYTCPFLVSVSEKPPVIGYYLNSVNDNYVLDFKYANMSSPVQFICNSLSVKRNALMGEDRYLLQIKLTPSSPLEIPSVDKDGVYNGLLKVGLTIENDGQEICYNDFSFKCYDKTNDIYTFELSLKTDDYLALNKKMRITNFKNITSEEEEFFLIPMIDCKFNILVFYSYPEENYDHYLSHLSDFNNFTLTNIYSAEKVNLIIPLNIMRSRLKILPHVKVVNGETIESFFFKIHSVPLISVNEIRNEDYFYSFIKLIFKQYNELMEVVDKITNNYGIDLKFFNTYGRSKSFTVGESSNLLDRTNISISLKISFYSGTVVEDSLSKIKSFIKDYIEKINDSASGALYISNLIKDLQVNFSEIKYVQFIKINDYDSSIQIIENKFVDPSKMTREERIDFVPEHLTIALENIFIEVV